MRCKKNPTDTGFVLEMDVMISNDHYHMIIIGHSGLFMDVASVPIAPVNLKKSRVSKIMSYIHTTPTSSGIPVCKVVTSFPVEHLSAIWFIYEFWILNNI